MLYYFHSKMKHRHFSKNLICRLKWNDVNNGDSTADIWSNICAYVKKTYFHDGL